MRDPDGYIYESIEDLDTTDWCCPTCSAYNFAPFVIGECTHCGFELDPDRFEQAVAGRLALKENGQ